MFGTLFALLYIAHLLADYPLQTDTQAARKAGWTEDETGRHHHGWGANLAHAATHIVVAAAVLGIGALVLDLPLDVPAAVAAVAWVGVSHSIIDRRWLVRRWMENTGQREFLKHGGAAHVDQTAHIAALAIAALGLAA